MGTGVRTGGAVPSRLSGPDEEETDKSLDRGVGWYEQSHLGDVRESERQGF